MLDNTVIHKEQYMSKIEKVQREIKKLFELNNKNSYQIPKEMQAFSWACIAIEYLTAASILEQKEPHFTLPKLQLTGHAIECSIKACIASVGAKTPKEHDLVKLYKIIEKHGFHLDDQYQAFICLLNHYYYQDLGTGTKFKSRFPPKNSEGLGGPIPCHSDMEFISNTLLEQAASRVPDNLAELFRTILIYRANLEKLLNNRL